MPGRHASRRKEKEGKEKKRKRKEPVLRQMPHGWERKTEEEEGRASWVLENLSDVSHPVTSRAA